MGGSTPQIDRREKEGSLTPQDAKRLKHAIIQKTLGLLEQGALIAEIPNFETIDNAKLLEGFGTKLLSPPVEGAHTADADESATSDEYSADESATSSSEDEYSDDEPGDEPSFSERAPHVDTPKKRPTRPRHT